jgi:hypothetical protein
LISHPPTPALPIMSMICWREYSAFHAIITPLTKQINSRMERSAVLWPVPAASGSRENRSCDEYARPTKPRT